MYLRRERGARESRSKSESMGRERCYLIAHQATMSGAGPGQHQASEVQSRSSLWVAEISHLIIFCFSSQSIQMGSQGQKPESGTEIRFSGKGSGHQKPKANYPFLKTLQRRDTSDSWPPKQLFSNKQDDGVLPRSICYDPAEKLTVTSPSQ